MIYTHRPGLPVLCPQLASRDFHINSLWHRVPSPPPRLKDSSFPFQPECLLSGPQGLSPTIPMGPHGPGLLTVHFSLHTGRGLLCLLSSRSPTEQSSAELGKIPGLLTPVPLGPARLPPCAEQAKTGRAWLQGGKWGGVRRGREEEEKGKRGGQRG